MLQSYRIRIKRIFSVFHSRATQQLVLVRLQTNVHTYIYLLNTCLGQQRNPFAVSVNLSAICHMKLDDKQPNFPTESKILLLLWGLEQKIPIALGGRGHCTFGSAHSDMSQLRKVIQER